MGEVEKKKKFKEPSEYYKNFLFHSLFTVIGLVALYFAISSSEEHILNYINRTSGNAEDKFGRLILRVLVMYLGRTGFIIGFSLCFIAITYEFYKEIAAYRRYKKKCKLYHEGLIENFHDIYDDYVPLLSWRRIKKLFKRKEKTYRKKYPSKRKMKKHIEELEKQYKSD